MLAKRYFLVLWRRHLVQKIPKVKAKNQNETKILSESALWGDRFLEFFVLKEKILWSLNRSSQLNFQGNEWNQFGEFVCGIWGLKLLRISFGKHYRTSSSAWAKPPFVAMALKHPGALVQRHAIVPCFSFLHLQFHFSQILSNLDFPVELNKSKTIYWLFCKVRPF